MQKIEDVYQQYSKIVYKYLLCLTGKEEIAEDLTQETFVIAVKEISKFKGNCKISVWLCQIAKHLWFKELKKSKRISITQIIPEEMISEETVEETIIEKEEKLILFKQIQKLDEQTKDVMYLRIFGNFNFNEIGEILGKTDNWARVIFYRGKQKIREGKENGKKK